MTKIFNGLAIKSKNLSQIKNFIIQDKLCEKKDKPGRFITYKILMSKYIETEEVANYEYVLMYINCLRYP